MASRIFRFYSLEPREIFEMAGKRWPSAIVRRNAWKVGDSPVWGTTLVLDELQPADEFDQWLARNAPKRNIRNYVGLAGRGDALLAYAQFHGAGSLPS